jgi:hypothetical protein
MICYYYFSLLETTVMSKLRKRGRRERQERALELKKQALTRRLREVENAKTEDEKTRLQNTAKSLEKQINDGAAKLQNV